jgi:predicted metal-dependent HD superfamily phosphohydrolase
MAPSARAIFVANSRLRESPQPLPADRIHGKNAVSHSDEHLNSVLETLEECRRILNDNDGRETAELLSIAILDLRMRLKGIASAELRALCDEMLRGAVIASAAKPSQQHRRPLLRVVK